MQINEPSLSKSESHILENGMNQMSLGNNEMSVWSSHSKSLKRYNNHIAESNDQFLLMKKEKQLRALQSHESFGDDNGENNSTLNVIISNQNNSKGLKKRVSFASSTISFPSDSEEFLENNNQVVFSKGRREEMVELQDDECRKQRVALASKLCDLEQERQITEIKAFDELDRDERRYNQMLAVHLMEQEQTQQLQENEEWIEKETLNRAKAIEYVINEQAKEQYRRVHSSAKQLQCPWVSNKSRTDCKSCSSSFWVLNRRHHCRLCGDVFDHQCCKSKIRIPFRYHGSVRVCVPCLSFRKELKQEISTRNSQ